MNDDTNDIDDMRQYENEVDALAAHFVRDMLAPGAPPVSQLLCDYLSALTESIELQSRGAPITISNDDVRDTLSESHVVSARVIADYLRDGAPELVSAVADAFASVAELAPVDSSEERFADILTVHLDALAK